MGSCYNIPKGFLIVYMWHTFSCTTTVGFPMLLVCFATSLICLSFLATTDWCARGWWGLLWWVIQTPDPIGHSPFSHFKIYIHFPYVEYAPLWSSSGFSGCHRYEAHQRLGLPTIRCKVRRGTKETLRWDHPLQLGSSIGSLHIQINWCTKPLSAFSGTICDELNVIVD